MKGSPSTDTPGLVANRACRNCVQIKVKCIPHDNSQIKVCQRCHRLGKPCTTPVPIIRKGRAKSTRVTQLEKRIDQLTALLTPAPSVVESGSPTHIQTSDPAPSAVAAAQPSTVTDSAQTEESSLGCTTFSASEYRGSWEAGSQPVARSGSPTLFLPGMPGRKDGSQLLDHYFCPVYLDPEFEARLFREFREKMLMHVPFVVIKSTMSIQDIKTQKPFTYWAGVTAASYRENKLHQKLHEEMMRAIGQRMLVSGAKTLDLLQGLILTVSWHHYISHYQPQLMNLLYLARALVADLGIGQQIRAQDKLRLASDATALSHGIETLAVTLDNDKRRAFLGCFCLSSRTALTFNRTEPMRYSQHIDDCCKTLKAAAEYETDLVLVELVQLHRILDKYNPNGLSGSVNASTAYRTIFQDEIQRFKQALPSKLQGHYMLELELYSGSLSVLEPSYEVSNQDHIARLDALHACVDVSTKFIDSMSRIPVYQRPHTTFSATMGLLQIMIVLARLSFFKCDGWDAQYARKTVNFGGFMQQIRALYEAGHHYEAKAYPNSTPWRFAMYAEKVKHIKAWYDAKVTAEDAALDAGVEESISNTFSEALFGGFDDAIWDDLMGPWTDLGQ